MSFVSDLERAKVYEEQFAKKYNIKHQNTRMEWLDTKFQPDFKVESHDIFRNSFFVEIKIDFTKHTNFFMEFLSNVKKETKGGPWQAQKYEAKYFVYWFVSPKNKNQWNCYVFETDKLVEWLDENKTRYQAYDVPNRTYKTRGYIIPISVLVRYKWAKKRVIEGV